MRTSRQGKRRSRWAVWAAAVAFAVALGGLALSDGPRSPASTGASAFIWLRPEPQPRGWKVAVTRSGARLAYPPGWREIRTDPGTVSAAPAGARGVFVGYLNATPGIAEETLANWSRFRPEHNGGEGDRRVHLIASASHLNFRSGRGSCVIDDYTTSKASYREIACLVSGPRSSAVVVAAAPIALWDQQAAKLERAVSSFVP